MQRRGATVFQISRRLAVIDGYEPPRIAKGQRPQEDPVDH
jgi:hypothetical protein